MEAPDRTLSTPIWNRLNRRAESFLLLPLLFGVFVIAHLLALTKVGLSLALVDDRTVGEIRLIQFVQSHLWVVALYFALLIAVWCWIRACSASLLVTFISLLLLSMPCLLYIRSCLHIGSKLLGITGP